MTDTNQVESHPFVSFSKIGSFKDAHSKILKFMGGSLSSTLPAVTYKGTVKVHGTNAAVVVWKDGEVTIQSRKRLLSEESDNAGFYSFAMHKVEASHWKASVHNIIDDFDAVAIYGEWCGSNIQKGVSISGMDKAFIIFSIQGLTKDLETEGEFTSTHLPIAGHALESQRIYEIHNFGTYELLVDHKDATTAVDSLNKLTLEVEANCPVGAELNPDSESVVGEGIVWIGQYESEGNTYTSVFKSKGKEHERGSGKQRTIKAPTTYSTEQLEAVEALTQVALKEDRLLQGLEYFKEMLIDIDKKNTSKYIAWVMKDIYDECQEEIKVLAKLDITWKQLTSPLIKSIVTFFKDQTEIV